MLSTTTALYHQTPWAAGEAADNENDSRKECKDKTAIKPGLATIYSQARGMLAPLGSASIFVLPTTLSTARLRGDSRHLTVLFLRQNRGFGERDECTLRAMLQDSAE